MSAPNHFPSLTHTLLAYHRKLWRRTLKENKSVLFNNLLILLYALSLSLYAVGSYMEAFEAGGDLHYVPALIAVGMLTYLLASVMLPNGEQQLYPERFRAYPITRRDLEPALIASWVFQLRPWAVVMCTTVSMISLLLLGAGWLTLPMLLIAGLTTMLLGEVASGLFSASSAHESWNKISYLLLMVFIIGFSLVSSTSALDQIMVIGAVVQWTPLGATGGAIIAAERGDWGEAGLFALIAVLSLGVLAWAWHIMIGSQLRAPNGSSRQRHRSHSTHQTQSLSSKQASRFSGSLLSYGPVGVVMARAWRYMRRDTRIFNQLAVYPLLGLMFLVQGVTLGEPQLFVGTVGLGLLGALSGANDFGVDGPSNWVTIISGVRPRTLLLARHAATTIVTFLTLLVYFAAVIVVVVIKEYNLVLAVLVVITSAGMFVGSSGVSLFSSVYGAYPTAKPGTNTWKDRSGYSSAAMVPAFIGLFTAWIPAAPGAILMFIGYTMELKVLLLIGILVLLAVPVTVYLVLARLAIRRFESQLPELYQKVNSWVG